MQREEAYRGGVGLGVGFERCAGYDGNSDDNFLRYPIEPGYRAKTRAYPRPIATLHPIETCVHDF